MPADIHGILLFDKPVGLSSAGAVARVKHLFGARKAGHTGSLDPLASGLLPVKRSKKKRRKSKKKN